MSTSETPGDRARSALPTRVLEVIALAAAFALAPELIGGGDPTFPEPHPGWIGVLILSARYGGGGFLAGATAMAAAIALVPALAGAGGREILDRLATAFDLVSLGGSLVVSWVVSAHLRREAALHERLRTLSERAAGAEEAVREFRVVVDGLRARVDRTSSSLGFLRDAATRLDGGDPVTAAEGAADLALARTGASVVAVSAGAGESARRLALREAGAPMARASIDRGGADLVVPIHVDGDRVGAIALWGISPAAVDRVTAHDLAVIAEWCGPALAAMREPAAEAS